MDRDRARETDPADERLLAALGGLAARFDPVPAELDSWARASLSWRSLDAELAQLSYDSVVDHEALAGVRTTGTEGRLLTFSTGGVTLDLQVLPEAEHVTLVGELDPPAAAEVEIRRTEGSSTVRTDEHGRFQTSRIPTGPASLRVRYLDAPGSDAPVSADATVVDTEWLPL